MDDVHEDEAESQPSETLVLDAGQVFATLEAERDRLDSRISDFARAIGVRPNLYWRWLKTKPVPDLGLLVTIATRLGWLVDELLVGVNPEYDAVRVRRLWELTRRDESVGGATDPSALHGTRAAPRESGHAPPAGVDTAQVESLAARRSPMPTDRDRLFNIAAAISDEDLPDALHALGRIFFESERRRLHRGSATDASG